MDMSRFPLLIVALLLPLAGCLGLPEGSIAPGDTITANVVVEDAHTGETLWTNNQLTFIAGTGASNLGFEFERQLMGKAQGFDGTLTVRDDPSLQWADEVRTEGVFEDDLLGTISEDQFRQFFGEPVEGEEFQPQFSFYSFRVEAIDAGTVTYRVLPEDGQSDDVPHLGATLVTTVDEAREVMIQTLVAIEGATFEVQPPSPFNPNTPLGLAPGAYRAVGNDGDFIVFEYASAGHPDIIGKDLRIRVEVLTVVPGSGQVIEPVDGNVGVRSSPVINGAPGGDVHYGPHSEYDGHAMAEADHGHNH